jgi:hypothetical protein
MKKTLANHCLNARAYRQSTRLPYRILLFFIPQRKVMALKTSGQLPVASTQFPAWNGILATVYWQLATAYRGVGSG